MWRVAGDAQLATSLHPDPLTRVDPVLFVSYYLNFA